MTKYILPLFMLPLLAQAETLHFKGTETTRVGGNPAAIVPKVVFVELGADEDAGTLSQRILRPGPEGQKVMSEAVLEAKKKSGDDWSIATPEKEFPTKVKFKSGKLLSLVSTTDTNGRKVIITTERPGEKDFANSLSVMSPEGKEVYSSVVKGNLITKAEFDSALAGQKIEKFQMQKSFARPTVAPSDKKMDAPPTKAKGKKAKDDAKK